MERVVDDYELFRSAIVERDSDAWEKISAHLRPVLIAWTARSLAVQGTSEQCEGLADEALVRIWATLSPEDFAAFPNRAALLAYLRRCVATTVIDATRSQEKYERAFQPVVSDHGTTPEWAVLERLHSLALWRLVASLTTTEAERVALYERFVLDLPPRTIRSRHPTLFSDVRAVYATVRNVCERLERHKPIRQLDANDLLG